MSQIESDNTSILLNLVSYEFKRWISCYYINLYSKDEKMFMPFTGQKETKVAICLLNSMIPTSTGCIREVQALLIQNL